MSRLARSERESYDGRQIDYLRVERNWRDVAKVAASFILSTRINKAFRICKSMAITSALGPQNLADLAIQPGGLTRGIINYGEPFLALPIELSLAQQVRRLHHILNRIAQIMGQPAKIDDRFVGGFLGFVFRHDTPVRHKRAKEDVPVTLARRSPVTAT
jgi:hypothetical protein